MKHQNLTYEQQGTRCYGSGYHGSGLDFGFIFERKKIHLAYPYLENKKPKSNP